MKKTFLKAALLSLTTIATFTITSCSNDDNRDGNDNGNGGNPSATINPADFKGSIASGTTVTLDPSETYQLTGKLVVEEGASLIIPAGTQVVAAEGSTYLIVDRGGKIFINGTESDPVVFEGASHQPGYWGGIVLLGNAPSNRSASGTSTSELGDMVYGGTNKEDNSGSINYLVIKDSGFKYNPEKEFNGLSLFGVGSGTTISHVYVTDGADDGIEFFGGNVNVDHIVVTGVGDDSVDWTEGWQGSASYIYAARKKEYFDATEPGNRGIEADTQDTDPTTTFGNGVSNPAIKNATFIGNLKGSESQGLKLRAGSQGKFDNIVIANFNTGLDFETERTTDWFTSGNYITNINFVSVPTVWASEDIDMSEVFSINPEASGAGNGTALPDWAKNWTGLTEFDVADAGN